MIHELIDPKKKTTRSTRLFNGVKTLSENLINPSLDQSDGDNKETESSSTTFIPPWLRNSLGLNQRNNQNLDWNVCLPNFTALGHGVSDQKTAKTISKFKEQNQNELKEKHEGHPCHLLTETAESVGKNNKKEPTILQKKGIENECNIKEKSPSMCGNTKRRGRETETVSASGDITSLRKEKTEIANTDVGNFTEIGKFKEEERKKMKFLKQKSKSRRKTNISRMGDLEKTDVDFLLEMKAREVVDDYVKKNIHSVSSDIKQLEAKLILLNAKCHEGIKSKLSQQEVRLLQETIDQAGNQERFEKLMAHIKEPSLKEIIKDPDYVPKMAGIKSKKCEEKEKKNFQNISNDGAKINSYEDNSMSTDDETDIKRFSEFLNNNKNANEKRRCLEEVRNYFEKKRRTQWTKRHLAGEFTSPSQARMVENHTFSKNEPKIKEIFNVMSNREKSNKFGLCNEEVVEKAVNETLQKFVSLYHFHVSPTVMGTMRKNILTAIQSDSLESHNSSQNLPVRNEVEKISNNKQLKKSSIAKVSLFPAIRNEQKTQQKSRYPDFENFPIKKVSVTSNYVGDEKESIKKDAERTDDAESDDADEESEGTNSLKHWKRKFENFLSFIRSYPDIINFRLQSLILESKEQESPDRSEFIYNFAKKALEVKIVDGKSFKPNPENSTAGGNKKTLENSGMLKTLPLKKNVKSQTVNYLEKREQNLQTEKMTCVGKATQTEKEKVDVKASSKEADYDVSPRLCRFVKSRQVEKSFFFPEKNEKSDSQFSAVNSNSPILKLMNCKVKKGKNKEVVKCLAKIRRAKEKGFFCRKGERKKTRSKRTYVVSTKHIHRFGEKNFFNSESCLRLKTFTKEGKIIDSKFEDPGSKRIQRRLEKNRLCCIWFWNGKRISPGCDLKTHVEDLLEAKLKEISSGTEGLKKESFDEKKEVDNLPNDPTLEFHAQSSKQIESGPFLRFSRKEVDPSTEGVSFAFSPEISSSPKMKCKTPKEKVKIICEEKQRGTSINQDESRNQKVGAKNSQQTFLISNLSKCKHRTKNYIAPGIGQRKSKKKSIFGKPPRKKEENFWGLNKVANVSVKKFSDLESGVGDCGDKNRKIFLGDSASEKIISFSNVNDCLENLFGFAVDLNNEECNAGEFVEETGIWEEQKTTGNAAVTVEEENSNDGPVRQTRAFPATDNQKHWELIDGVLNRVDRKERESLWNDIRQLIKTKIGRDINDDGAQEVCIEIEQDMPKAIQGKKHPSILAKGHYVRSEGDVEVEIDLTLNDLERILRRRQKKIRKPETCGKRSTRRILSSSSELSEYARDELHMFRRNLRRLSGAGKGFVRENALKVLPEDKDKSTK